MTDAIVIDGLPYAIIPGVQIVDADGIKHPPNIVDLWSNDELAAIGVYKNVDMLIPPGKVAVGSSLEMVDGRPQLVFELADAAPEPPPNEISDRQFAQALWQQGIITFEECKAFVSVGAIPAAMQALVDMMPDTNDGTPSPRKNAIIFISGAKTYEKNHPVTQAICAAYGWSQEQLDGFWAMAAGL